MPASGGPPADEGVAGGGGFHHREFENRGWTCIMIAGIPHFVPPAWLDPDRKPLRNHAHDPTAAL